MSYNIAKYVIGWRFNDPHDGVKMYLKPFSCSPPMRRFEYLTLKMKVKNIEDLDESWQTNDPDL